jgi:hypothetical protein
VAFFSTDITSRATSLLFSRTVQFTVTSLTTFEAGKHSFASSISDSLRAFISPVTFFATLKALSISSLVFVSLRAVLFHMSFLSTLEADFISMLH